LGDVRGADGDLGGSVARDAGGRVGL